MSRILFLIAILVVTHALIFASFSDASENSTLAGFNHSPTSMEFGQSYHQSSSKVFGIGAEFPKLFLGMIVPNKRGGQFIELENSNFQGSGIRSILQMFPYSGGCTFGISEVLSLGQNWNLDLEGFYLRPQIDSSQSFYFFDHAQTGNYREWSQNESSIGLLGVELRGMWNEVWLKDGWSICLGLRFDSLSLSFKDPTSVSGPLMASSPGFSSADSLDITSRAYVPYVGLYFSQKNHYLTGSFRGIVFPLVLGEITYKESFLGAPMQSYSTKTNFEDSFLIEIYGDVAYRIARSIDLGCFMKMGIINSYPKGTLEINQGANILSSISYNMNYRKIQYLVGAQIQISSW